jgi:hypothetical protein
MYRLGHGLIAQEVLEELQALPRAVEGNLVPRTSDRHQCQALVHLAPSTNLSKFHTIRASQTDKICFENKEGFSSKKKKIKKAVNLSFLL